MRNGPILVCVMGVTNTGKSTLLDRMKTSEKSLRFGFIEVGKELRRRHPPEYFNGFAAMKETEEEVWDIFDKQYNEAKEAGADYIICDGQPRMDVQLEVMKRKYAPLIFILLTTEDSTLKKRAGERDLNNSSATKLSMDRLRNDFSQMYYVLAEILKDPNLRNLVIVQPTDEPMTQVYLPALQQRNNLGSAHIPWEEACIIRMLEMSYDL